MKRPSDIRTVERAISGLQPDGQEHMGNLVGILAAGRAGRHVDLLGGQGEEDGLGFEAEKGEVQGALDRGVRDGR